MTGIRGIDISKWNGSINWPKVAADGVQFAIIRVGYGSKKGTPTLDPTFHANVEGALSAGIEVGTYLYSYALDVENAELESIFTVDNISRYVGKMTYPVFYDIEDDSQKNLGIATISHMCEAFCGSVSMSDWKPGIYASLDWVKTRIYPATISKYDLWLAQWTKSPTYQGRIAIWQYSDSGRVDGISGNVDMNVAYYTQQADKPAPVADKPTLKKGSQGEAVVLLQTALAAFGYVLKPDGVFGPLTHATVKQFQRAKGLLADGIVGPKTHSELDKGGDHA